MEIRQVAAELFHADRHDEANSRFSQFCVQNFPDDIVFFWCSVLHS